MAITDQSSRVQNFSQIYPLTNQISVQGLKQDFTLSSNIEGRWKLPDGTYQTGSTITYPYLLQQYTGLYTFYLYNWDGIEVPAIQTNITTTDNIGIISISNMFDIFTRYSIFGKNSKNLLISLNN